jgi:thiol-disulfide isomerase/thioredoxin
VGCRCSKWMLVVVLAAASGCGGDAQVGPSPETRGVTTGDASLVKSSAAAASPDAGAPGEDSISSDTAITVQIVDRQAFDRLLAGHLGKVVLVDFWATWCPPCVQQFPHTVELARRYADQGLAVVSVSIDDADDIERVRTFLAERKATFDNVLADAGSSNATANAFELDAGVPQYRVYDRSGQLLRSFAVDPEAERQFTPDDVEQAVRQALALGPS